MSTNQEPTSVVIFQQENVAPLFLSVGAVKKMTGLSQSTIDRMSRRGELPKPLQITQRRIAYRASDIQAWMNGLKAASR